MMMRPTICPGGCYNTLDLYSRHAQDLDMCGGSRAIYKHRTAVFQQHISRRSTLDKGVGRVSHKVLLCYFSIDRRTNQTTVCVVQKG